MRRLLKIDESRRPIYAHARISIYWIVNIGESKIEVYTRPEGGQVGSLSATTRL